VRGISYRRRQQITQYTPLVRQGAVTISPIDSTAVAPSFAATVFVSDPW
jgi:hypothetical protein